MDNGLLYHHETIMGHKVNQLCLPECRIPIVLKMGGSWCAIRGTHGGQVYEIPDKIEFLVPENGRTYSFVLLNLHNMSVEGTN